VRVGGWSGTRRHSTHRPYVSPLSVALAELAVLWLHQVPTTSESNSESDVAERCP
jgi:hypothetical protein